MSAVGSSMGNSPYIQRQAPPKHNTAKNIAAGSAMSALALPAEVVTAVTGGMLFVEGKKALASRGSASVMSTLWKVTKGKPALLVIFAAALGIAGALETSSSGFFRKAFSKN